MKVEQLYKAKRPYWLSWYHRSELQGFELHFPYWVSGHSTEGDSICAGVLASSEQEAQELIYAAYDITPDELSFRFIEELALGQDLYSERFPQSSWMGTWPLRSAEYDVDHICACSLHKGSTT